MCRSIKRLRNAAQPATPDEVRAAALQFVRKISGYNAPSRANQAAFEAAVNAITSASNDLLTRIEERAPCSTTSKTSA